MARSNVKNEKQYEALRRGASTEKAARIANASAGSSRSPTGRTGAKSQKYQVWSERELYDRPSRSA